MNLEQKPLVIWADIGGSHITAAIINVDEQCLIESSSIRNLVNTHGIAEEILSVYPY
jgi:glucokinase